MGTGNSIYNIDSFTEKYLLKELADDVQELKRHLPNNLFLDQLNISTKTGEIHFPKTKQFSAEYTLYLKEAIAELMAVEELKISDNLTLYPSEIVDDLVKYQFLTTGFKPTLTSFHHLIPADYFISKFHGVSVKKFIDKNSKSMPLVTLQDATQLMAKNNPNSYKYVKKLSKKTASPASDRTYGELQFKDDNYEKVITYTNLKKEHSFSPFVMSNKKLYMLVDTKDNKPIYEKIDLPDRKKSKRIYSKSQLDPEKSVLLMKNEYISKSNKLYKSAGYNVLTQKKMDEFELLPVEDRKEAIDNFLKCN